MAPPLNDTRLARLLLERGRLDMQTLLGLLTQVRGDRAAGTLAETLVARGLVPEAELRAYVAELSSAATEPLPTAAPASRDWGPGLRVDDLVIERKLGAGGMGAVYVALDTRTGARYAVKALPRSASAEDLLRFGREAVAQAAADQHPNVVRIHRSGQAAGQAYLVMDLATGGDLESRLANGPLPPLDAATLIRDLARGLAHVHANGVLHRDLKPANVVFGEGNVPKLLDFGLARCEGADTLTQSGTVLGTPGYMAPEQIDTSYGAVAASADVYGLGAVLYHCLTGRAPFQGASVYGTLLTVLNERPVPPQSVVPEIPAGLEAICLRCLEKSPAARPESAEALAAELDAFLAGAAVRPSSRAWVGVLALLAGTGAAAAWGLNHTSEPEPVAAPPPLAIAPLDSASRSKTAPPRRPPKLETEAELEERRGEIHRLTETIRRLRSRLFAKRTPETTQALADACKALLKLAPSAEDLLDESARIELQGGIGDVLMMLASLKRPEQLLEFASLHCEGLPAPPRVHQHRGEALRQLKRYAQALEAYTLAIEAERLEKRVAQLFLKRSSVHLASGDHARALSDVDESTRRFPSGVTYAHHRLRGLALYGLGRYREALASHDRAFELAKNGPPSAHRRARLTRTLGARAEARVGVGDFAGAIQDLDELLLVVKPGPERLHWTRYRQEILQWADSPTPRPPLPTPR